MALFLKKRKKKRSVSSFKSRRSLHPRTGLFESALAPPVRWRFVAGLQQALLVSGPPFQEEAASVRSVP